MSRLTVGEFRIERAKRGRAMIVEVGGEVDIATVGAMRAAMAVAEQDVESLVVDLSQATFIDSAGIQALAEAQHRTRHNRVHLVVITAAASAVDRALELVDARDWLSIVHDHPDPPNGAHGTV